MPGITGMGTTFNLPNYHGELFALTPADTPLLSAIGNLTGGEATDTKVIEWETYDLREPEQRTRTEGAVAPTAEGRVRANVSNVVEIHQEKVSTSYTKRATPGQFAANAEPIATPNPVRDEHTWQIEQALKQIARDVNFSFINGQFQNPTDNLTPRKTRGLMQAINLANTVDMGTNAAVGASSATTVITPTAAHSLVVGDIVFFTRTGNATNIVTGRPYYVQAVTGTTSFSVAATEGGPALVLGTSNANINYHSVAAPSTVLTVKDVNKLAQRVFDGGGLTDGLGTFLVNSSQRVALSAAYAEAYGKANPLVSGERIGGVVVDQIVTDFGTLNIMLDRSVPRDAIILTSLSQLTPRFLNIVGKGSFFEEPLAKVGASDDSQLYGEIGLEYGSPVAHGVMRGLPFEE